MCNMPDYQTFRRADLQTLRRQKLFNLPTLHLINFYITFAYQNSNTGSYGRKDKIFG